MIQQNLNLLCTNVAIGSLVMLFTLRHFLRQLLRPKTKLVFVIATVDKSGNLQQLNDKDIEHKIEALITEVSLPFRKHSKQR